MTDDVILTESETPETPATKEDVDEGQEEQLQDTDGESEGEGDGTEGEADEGDQHEDEDEEIEFDFGGAKERFSKKATVAEVAERIQNFSKQIYGDYIQKTQKIAAQHKALESRAEELQVLGEGSREYFANFGLALQQGQYLDSLRAVDVQKLWQEDPDQARKVSDEIRRVEGQLQQLSQEMERTERATREKQTEIYAKRTEEGKKAVNQRIPDFETKHAADVVRYVTSTYSITDEDAQKWFLSPDVAVMAYKAMLFDRSKAQAKAPPKPRQAEVPVKAIKGRGTVKRLDPASPDSDNLSDEEWFKLRNKQVYGR